MKIVWRILVIILIIIAIIYSAGFLLPKHVKITRTKLIKSYRSFLFDMVNTLKNWEYWSPWYRIDPRMKVQYSASPKGSGAFYSWQSINKNIGTGKLTILQSVPDDSIVMEIDFMDNGKASTIFKFRHLNEYTYITWSFESELGINPLARYAGLFIDKMVGPDLVKGLDNLDSLAKLNNSKISFSISEKDLPQRIVLTIRDSCTSANIPTNLAYMFRKLAIFIKAKHLKILNPPFAVFYRFSENQFDMEAGYQVDRKISTPRGIKSAVLPEAHTVFAKYYGPYEGTGKTYSALQKYIEVKHLKICGSPFEEYVTDSGIEKDSSKWLTNIYYMVSKDKIEN